MVAVPEGHLATIAREHEVVSALRMCPGVTRSAVRACTVPLYSGAPTGSNHSLWYRDCRHHRDDRENDCRIGTPPLPQLLAAGRRSSLDSHDDLRLILCFEPSTVRYPAAGQGTTTTRQLRITLVTAPATGARQRVGQRQSAYAYRQLRKAWHLPQGWRALGVEGMMEVPMIATPPGGKLWTTCSNAELLLSARHRTFRRPLCMHCVHTARNSK